MARPSHDTTRLNAILDISSPLPYTNTTMLTTMESMTVAFLLAATAAMRKLRAVNWPIAVSGPLVRAA